MKEDIKVHKPLVKEQQMCLGVKEKTKKPLVVIGSEIAVSNIMKQKCHRRFGI